ncbi:MAG: Na/Pi symporter [Kiritimatiellae bacterium]|nr:Na/Pi symporter [Kiritimatiellia bacterium]MDD4341695.1 Na/Pi symporter [Kiritimatiellia bacterium]
MKKQIKWIVAGFWIMAAVVAHADDRLLIRGSDTFGEELGPRLIAAFQEEEPTVDVELSRLGSTSGIAALLEDTSDIAVSSRLFNDDELRIARSRGIALKSAIGGYYGVAVVVNAQNPLKNLSDHAIRDIFTGRIQNWKQVGGPDRRIEVLIRDATGGTHLGFRRLAMGNSAYTRSARTFANYAALADDLAAHPNAIGYVGMNFMSRPDLNPLSVNGVSPSDATVREGLYPYVEPILLYSRVEPCHPATERFIRFVGAAGGQDIVKSIGFVSADLGRLGPQQLFFLVFQVLGGLGLFIFGMNIMSESLRIVAGNGLRTMLSKATTNRFSGLALGTTMGALIHSSAASVMLVGFINAGLMSLPQAIAPMLGTNLGTSLSMQLVSFRLTDYCFTVIAIGIITQMAIPNPRAKAMGRVLIGFGLLFLGMKTMSDAIAPHRDLLRQFMVGIDGHTFSGRLLGAGLAFGLTAIIQSSGATIGMSFALTTAGVFDSLWQVYPIVIGAQIGTCATALLGSIGASIEARRAAVANLLTNVFNAIVSILLAPLWIPLFAATSPDVVRQIANTHTLLMIQNCCVFMPIVPIYARFIRKVVPSRTPPPEPSYLLPDLLDYPEKAIYASIRELQRVARICAVSQRLAGQTILFAHTTQEVHTIKLNEKAINEIKLAVKNYLGNLTKRYLSKRQAVLIQYIDRCMSDLERIGDHIDTICDLSLRRQKIPEAIVDPESFDMLFQLYETAFRLFKMIIDSLDPDQKDFQAAAQQILQIREDYIKTSQRTRALYVDKVSQRLITPIAGIYLSDYIGTLDRIMKHCKSIALVEMKPQFWVKHSKLGKKVEMAPLAEQQRLVDPEIYETRLQECDDD